jgi:hypothetical protein
MNVFDALSATRTRRRSRPVAVWCGLVGLVAGSAALLAAGPAGAQGPGSVSGVSVNLSTSAAGATEVDYTAAFTTSSTGALDPNSGTITLSTSGTTSFATDCSFAVTDVTTGKSSPDACPTASASSSVTIDTGGVAIGAGDTVRVVAAEVASAPTTGSQSFSISTSSDLASSALFSLVGASPVTGVTVKVSNTAAGAKAKYTVAFTTSATGRLDGTFGQIELSGPKGTKFPPACTYIVTDLTTGVRGTACGGSGAANAEPFVLIYYIGVSIGAGDQVSVKTPKVRNSKKAGTQALSVWTSSDLTASGTFTLT